MSVPRERCSKCLHPDHAGWCAPPCTCRNARPPTQPQTPRSASELLSTAEVAVQQTAREALVFAMEKADPDFESAARDLLASLPPGWNLVGLDETARVAALEAAVLSLAPYAEATAMWLDKPELAEDREKARRVVAAARAALGDGGER